MKASCFISIPASCLSVALALVLLLAWPTSLLAAQDTLTGAFEGTVSNSQTGEPVAGAAVEIVNQQTGLVIPKRSDTRGRFYQGLLNPGLYTIRVAAAGYQTREVVQRLFITRTGEVVPVPVSLDPVPAGAAATSSPSALTEEDTDVRARFNSSDAQRGGSFTEEEVSTLPLGSVTLTRTFDELTLLLPGVAPPPRTLGSVAGPGVGAGVGTSGQFAVNGLRSRGNNFTVDGSDNNDEDIGVRRQGFVALVPQPIESIKEYQAITLLAPAQFGRNIGAQVNAVSKSGGNETHGTLYGLFNASQLNARNFFDATGDNTIFALRAGDREVRLNNRPLMVLNENGGEDSFTLGHGGLALGGPLVRDRMFYFVSVEGQVINATKEENFAVPTVEQRGANGTGATGISVNPLTGAPVSARPNTPDGEAIFSLFPFPNNPNGIYGANTLTQVLPASRRVTVLSGKLDYNFKVRERVQTATGRYNFTNDWRDIPATGGALFSTLRPRVRTQNFSFFFNSEVSAANSTRPMFNQLRLSYGRTRLVFEEAREQEFLIPSGAFPETPFLLNAPLLENFTIPTTGFVNYRSRGFTVDSIGIGPVGQVIVSGFSPVGVDVFNFPQRRVNNTYQVADTLTWRIGNHSFTFGGDTRRTELNSDLPRNARPLMTFTGAPEIVVDAEFNAIFTGRFVRPETLVAAGAASGIFLTLARESANINLRFYQLDFFGQDEWRIRPNLSLSYGLRYEYNTPPREANGRIERTFNDPALELIPDLRRFIDGREQIFDADLNNFGPRIGVAYSPKLFGKHHGTVIRGGYGLFYDQILGAVVSQSRNVFPTFLTANFAGGLGNASFPTFPFIIFNPANPDFAEALATFGPDVVPGFMGLVQRGTPNTLVPNSLGAQIQLINLLATPGSLSSVFAEGTFPSASGVGITLPARQLKTPMAHHYSVAVEQQIGSQMVVSAAYVGTTGRHLLRFTTPNLGPNAIILPLRFDVIEINPDNPGVFTPTFLGIALQPYAARPLRGVGTVNIFETTAQSRYDSLQLQMRGRVRRSVQYQLTYTLAKAFDDVSDVFDLAGAAALPQNSLTFAGERGFANFDVRHRFTYNFIYGLPNFANRSAPLRFLLGDLQIAGTGRIQTGQPFTVNSIFDVNSDGNLTDRLNTTNGLVLTGDRRQPLRLDVDPATLLVIDQDGAVGRNTFRAGNTVELDLAAIKSFKFNERHNLAVRLDLFNFINRRNFGIPVRFLEAPGFGQATDTTTPGRRLQLALKYSF